MNPQRLATMAAVGREVALPALVIACLAGFGSAGLERTGAAPVVNRIAPVLAANFSVAPRREIFEPAIPLKYDGVSLSAVSDFATMSPTEKAPANAPSGAEIVAANDAVKSPASAIEASAASKTIISSADPTAAGGSGAGAPSTTGPSAAESRDVGAPVANADVSPASTPSSDKTAPSQESKSYVTASLSKPNEVQPETPDGQSPSVIAAAPAMGNKGPANTVEILDECYVVAACVDRYLWTLYQRTPKEDSVKETEQKQVTVKRKGKTVTVTRTSSSVKDEDFGWKDPKAADRAGMTMPDYVIGGMDPAFKLRLFRLLIAAEQAGLVPGITSAFRDDYRQSIASGLKAASNRSFHGGSLRGGYSHGLAADIVSIKGDTRQQRLLSSDALWRWVDLHGKDYGIGRPYHDRDPPHVGPLDGDEYVSRHPGKKTIAAAKKPKGTATPAASPDATGDGKHQTIARSGKPA